MFTKNSLLTSVTAGALLSLTTLSIGANAIDNSGGNCLFNPAPYVGLNLGWAKFHGGDTSSDNIAGGVLLGYDFTKNFATELSYNRLSHATNLVDLAARLNVPVSNYVSIFGKAGPAWLKPSHASPSILPEAGIGVAFLPAQNTKLQLGYTHVFGHHDVSSLNYVAASVAYKFAM